MNKKLKSLCASLALAAVSTTALADVGCEDSTAITGSFGYMACAGSFSGNISAGQNSLVSFDGYGAFSLLGTTDDADEGPFIALTQTPGSLTFDAPVEGLFVLGIKGGPTYSLYLFDGGDTGISSISFDTLGVAKGNGKAGPDLSHAALFMPAGLPVSAVPEASSYAMLLAGLGMLGVVVRRRRG